MGKLKNAMTTKLFRTKPPQENVDKNDKSIESIKVPSLPESPRKKEFECFLQFNDFNDIHDINTLKEKLYHLERSFLYEQNSIIEKIEQEKYEIVENFRHEKKLLKKLHDREKLDLLKEIERKDKIIHQLARVFKEEHERKTKEVEEELLKKLNKKSESLHKIENKTRSFMTDLRTFIENNQGNICDSEDYNQLFKDFDDISNIVTQNNDTSLSESMDVPSDESKLSLKFDRLLNLNSTADVSLCNCKSFESIEHFDETVIQHELAQAYRKQKTELLRLFNNEKEEYEKTLNTKHKRYENDVRKEYEKRMTIERKAWQDTIEDYEREISILKYEREQMDRNYCIGMDQLKTEFEREKQTLHRRYREMHAELKRTLMLSSKPRNDESECK